MGRRAGAGRDQSAEPLIDYSILSNVNPDGDGNDAFRIEGDQLLVNDPDDFDYATHSSHIITVEANDSIATASAQVTVSVLEAVNEAPTGVALTNTVTSLPEDTDTTNATKLADIVITDDGEGDNAISLTGTDAASFTVVGTELFLAAGTSLDYETKNSYAVTVSLSLIHISEPTRPY